MSKIFLGYIVVVVIGFIGWIMNIVAIVNSGPFAEWGGMMIARVIGVFIVPIGAVLGYF